MGLFVPHFRSLVVKPTLRAMGGRFDSDAATELLIGTAIKESGLRYLHQLGAGPALGVFQMEPATAQDITHRYLRDFPAVEPAFERGFLLDGSTGVDWSTVDPVIIAEKLISDLRFATAMARLKYWMSPLPLPDVNDVPGQARYWKTIYNTKLSVYDEGDYVKKYNTRGRLGLDQRK